MVVNQLQENEFQAIHFTKSCDTADPLIEVIGEENPVVCFGCDEYGCNQHTVDVECIDYQLNVTRRSANHQEMAKM